MQNKRGKLVVSNVAFGEIFLVVTAVFAFAFIIGQVNLVSGQTTGTQCTFASDCNAKYGSGNYQCSGGYCQLLSPNIGDSSSSNSVTTGQGSGGTATLAGGAGTLAVASEIKKLADPGKNLLSDATPPELKPEGSDTTHLTDSDLGKKTSEAPEAGLFSGLFGDLLQGLTWGAIAGGAAYLIAGIAGASSNLQSTLGLSIGIGTFVGKFAYEQFGKDLAIKGFLNSAQAATVLGVGVAALVFVLLYKKQSTKMVQFECLPYSPPLGGASCEKCNQGDLPCSEYRCKSLGQACDLINVGTTEEKCVWINREDVTSPVITPSEEFLTEGHRYTNQQTRPPSLGTNIIRSDSTNGCIKPFTPLEFGFTTNEPAKCKIDTTNKATLDEMQFYFGGNSLFVQNHSEKLNLPSPDAIADFAGDELVIGKDGLYDFYVRCTDANGNENVDEFVFSFCVDPAPDTTPPIIEDTSIQSGSFVAFGADNVDLQVYVNEPSECKWSTLDKAYEDMENTMECSKEVYQQNARQLYTCSTTLTGVKDREQNDFYFRCKDQPNKEDNERNVNTQSYDFSLFGSQELNILSVSPNETVYGSTEFVPVDLEVETANGVNEGVATCLFSDTGEPGSYISMYETDGYKHKQTLSLAAGDYEVFFRCVDAGGNSDESSTQFSIFVDKDAPKVTRIYKEGVDALKFITNEEAECTYSLNNCNFAIDEGLDMQVLDPEKRTTHFAKWDPGSIYYVKCRDPYGNQPSPDKCTIEVSASNFV